MKKIIEVTVDHLEGEKAVLLYGEECISINWPCAALPSNVMEGDVLSIVIEKDQTKTEEALQETENLLRDLLENNS